MEFNQEWLDQITQEDKCDFLKDVSNWCNHRPLLYLAIKLSQVGDILELGCGEGSTNQLHCLAEEMNRNLVSYDFHQGWLDRYSTIGDETHRFVCTPDPTNLVLDCTKDRKTTVCLVDHSPGERRWEDIRDLADKVDLVVVHDSESVATGYMLDRIWPLYKYRININTIGACAALVSNTIDITKFDGLTLGGWTLEIKIV